MRIRSGLAIFAALAPATTFAASIDYGTRQAAPGLSKRNLTPPSDLPGTWQYYGCYSDSVSQRALSLASYTDASRMTDESCINWCSAKGYTFAGTEYSKQCYCGLELGSGSTSYPNDCTMSCTGNPSEPCGGHVRLSVFTNGQPGPQTNPGVNSYVSLGCYTDSVSARTLSHLAQIAGGSAAMTVAACTAACSAKGYSIAGVEYAGECWCDNGIENGAQPVAGDPTASGCDKMCNDNLSEFCGGDDRINLYKLPTPVEYVSDGDFETGSNWADGTNPENNNQGELYSIGYVETTWAYSGSYCWEIVEYTYGDSGDRSLCVQQTVDVETAGSYDFSAAIGRIPAPPPGSAVSTDDITYDVFVGGRKFASGTVCNLSQGTCSAKAVNGQLAYDIVRATVTFASGDLGYQDLSICATYTDPRRGTEDTFIVDAVSLLG